MRPAVEYEIVDIDYWEGDATLVIDGLRLYFQFPMNGWIAHREPTLRDALQFLARESRHYNPEDEEWRHRLCGFDPI